jgi:hypothetical protein
MGSGKDLGFTPGLIGRPMLFCKSGMISSTPKTFFKANYLPGTVPTSVEQWVII